MKFVVLSCILGSVYCHLPVDDYVVSKDPLVTHLVWFDMKIDDADAGRIVFGLFGRTVRKTVKNFVDLAKPDRIYKGHKTGTFDYVFKGAEIAGGNNACDSDYGYSFPKENFKLKHWGAGWVAAFNRDSKSAYTCRFYITLREYHELDKKNVVFGKILHGMRVIEKISDIEVDDKKLPKRVVLIANCGTELADPPFRVPRTGATD